MTYQAVLYTRSAAPGVITDVYQQVLTRLEQLETDGVLDAVDCEVWGDAIPADATSDAPSRRVYDEFMIWARENGYRLAPAFTRSTDRTIIDTEPREVIRFPLLCLAIYTGSDLQAVFPYHDSDRAHTVEDGLVALEQRRHLVEREDAEKSETAPDRPRDVFAASLP